MTVCQHAQHHHHQQLNYYLAIIYLIIHTFAIQATGNLSSTTNTDLWLFQHLNVPVMF